jgi:hypothetical protein
MLRSPRIVHQMHRLRLRLTPCLVRISLARILLPVFALVTIAFALLQLFSGGIALREGQLAMGAFYCLMGVGGCALATALWRGGRKA